VLAGGAVYENLLGELVPQVESLKVGDIWAEDTEMGSVISSEQFDKISGFVERAANAGAKVLTGGEPLELGEGRYFYKPTVISDVGQDAEIVQNEVFGPVVTVQRVEDEGHGARVGERPGLRPGCERVDPRRRPRAADGPQAAVRHGLDQHAHPAHARDCRTAATSRAGTAKDMSIYSIEEYTNIKHVMASLD
jgi:betaine-aldehyde dehydrogenase/aminobutyraldehyde dehydrogenase